MARLPYVFGLLIAALVIAGPLVYRSWLAAELRNFREVREGVLYRSGQMPLSGLKRAVHDYHIKTVVSLRDAHQPGDPPPDREEETYCRKIGLTYYRLSPVPWSAKDGSVPAEKNVRLFRDIMGNSSNYPVLVHCFAGKHRTGAYCAIYRMEQEHWSNGDAITEMTANGYDLLEEHEDLRTYLQHYRPAWQEKGPQAANSNGAPPQQ